MKDRRLLQVRVGVQRPLPLAGRRLREQIDSFVVWAEDCGLQIKSRASDYAHQVFCRLRIQDQRRILRSFQTYFEVLKTLRQRGQDPWDSKRFLWAYLSKHQLQPCSAVLRHIEGNEALEIFSRDYTQVFRNFQFLEAYSGSLFDLLVLDWMTLFRREVAAQEKLFLQMEASFRQSPSVQEFVDSEAHQVQSRFGKSEFYFVQHLIRSPLLSREKRRRRVENLLVSSRWLGSPSRFSFAG
ncbi:MAG: hypothetical protein EA369_09140 [Bradymonadales bacterium]|nr:MAG: hypothetical protein EA369_09140 [Bradymonadales bacterium]